MKEIYVSSGSLKAQEAKMVRNRVGVSLLDAGVMRETNGERLEKPHHSHDVNYSVGGKLCRSRRWHKRAMA